MKRSFASDVVTFLIQILKYQADRFAYQVFGLFLKAKHFVLACPAQSDRAEPFLFLVARATVSLLLEIASMLR